MSHKCMKHSPRGCHVASDSHVYNCHIFECRIASKIFATPSCEDQPSTEAPCFANAHVCSQANTSLTNLILNVSDIAGPGLAAIKDGLRENTTLTALDLRDSEVRPLSYHCLAVCTARSGGHWFLKCNARERVSPPPFSQSFWQPPPAPPCHPCPRHRRCPAVLIWDPSLFGPKCCGVMAQKTTPVR